MRVLLITGNRALRAAFEPILRGEGWAVAVREGGAAAACRELAPAVVVIDWAAGAGFCREVRAASGGTRPVILAALPDDGPGTVGAALDAGADDWVTADAGALAARVRVAGRRWRERGGGGAAGLDDPFFDLSLDLLAVANFDGYFTRVNPAFERTLGHGAAELLAVPYLDFVHPDDRALTIAEARKLGAGALTVSFENRYRHQDGSYRWLSWSATPAAERGLVYAVAHDVTDHKRAIGALRLLDRAGAVLTASLDYETTLASVARLIVPALADWCVIDIVEGGEGAAGGGIDAALAAGATVRRTAVSQADPERGALARELQERYPVDPRRQNIVIEVMRGGEPHLIPEITDAFLVANARDARHLAILRQLGMRSHLIVPMAARGRTLGAITLVGAESGRRYGGRDLALARDLAGRAALAVDNARLYQSERRTREAAERATERIGRLQGLTADLADALTPEQVAERIAGHGVAALAAYAGAVALVSEDGASLEVARASGYGRDLTERWQRFPLAAAIPLADAARTGEPVLLESREAFSAAYPAVAAGGLSAVSQAFAAVPLLVEGRAIGALAFSFATARAFDDEDRAFMLALARQCAQALERGRLYAAERRARAAAEAAGRRLTFLATASTLLAASLEYEETLASVAHLAVPELADWCAVDVVEEDGAVRRMAVAHADPAKEEYARELQRRYPLDPGAAYGVAKVLRTGRPDFHPEVSDAMLVAAARDAEHLAILRGLGLGSYMVVPLIARGQTLGTITFASARPERRYGAEDLALAEDLARRAGVAIDNARLYREARRAIRARDHFLAVATHELRTPLTSIRGNAELLLRRVRQPDYPLERAGLTGRLEQLLIGVERMNGLAARLLDVSRMQGGAFDIAPETADLAALVAATVERAREALPPAGDTIIVCEAPATPVVGEFDPVRIEQVVANLVQNAVKYQPDGGTILVRLEGTAEAAVLRVRDAGIGTPAGDLPHLFTPFARAENAVAAQIGGVGVGLYIADQIVRRHGGTIGVESAPGAGSEFTVRLPLRRGA